MSASMPSFSKSPVTATPVEIMEGTVLPAERYAALTESDKATVQAFAADMVKQLHVLVKLRVIVGVIWLYGWVIRRFGKLQSESDWLAALGGISRPMMAAIQRLYTLSHAAACSTLCYWDDAEEEMVCMRSLDWPGAEGIAKATRLFHHRHAGQSSHYAVAPLGMLGLLTAVRPGVFSVVINWAPSRMGFMGIHIGTEPTFALRELMEQQPASYAEAVVLACGLQVSSPVFITVCGVRAGEACVVEVGKGPAHVRSIGGAGWLVQTNHYDPEGPNGRYNVRGWNDKSDKSPVDWYNGKLPLTSGQRQAVIGKTMEEAGSPWQAYETAPVWNHECAYWAEMRPARDGADCIQAWVRSV
jgi:hypothetical protein